jgi:hypothetical protein
MATRKKSATEAAASKPETPAPVMAEKAPADAPPVESVKAPAKPKKTPAKAEKAPAEDAAPAAPAEDAAPAAPAEDAAPAAPAKAKKAPAKSRKASAKPASDDVLAADEDPAAEEADPAAAAEVVLATEEVPAAAPPTKPAPRAPYVAPMAPLPDAFGTDRVVIMARDPESAFIYWEVTANGVGHARTALGDTAVNARLTLRIYVGEGATARFEDHTVSDWLGRFTYFAPQPGLRLAASVGYLAENVFVHISQSLPARLPRRGHGNDPIRFVRVGPRRLTPPQKASAPDIAGLPGTPGGPAAGPGLAPSAGGSGGSAGAPAGSHHLVPTSETRR